jgi:hypothetical protein
MINKSDDIIGGIMVNHEIIMVRIMVIWLVVLTILKHMSSSMGRIIPYGKYKMLESTNQNNMGVLTIIGNWCWTIVGEYSSFCVSSIPVTIQQALVLY